MNTATIDFVAEAVATFAADLKNASDMGSRKDAIQFLANKIGAASADSIAYAFGLTDNYYRLT